MRWLKDIPFYVITLYNELSMARTYLFIALTQKLLLLKHPKIIINFLSKIKNNFKTRCQIKILKLIKYSIRTCRINPNTMIIPWPFQH